MVFFKIEGMGFLSYITGIALVSRLPLHLIVKRVFPSAMAAPQQKSHELASSVASIIIERFRAETALATVVEEHAKSGMTASIVELSDQIAAVSLSINTILSRIDTMQSLIEQQPPTASSDAELLQNSTPSLPAIAPKRASKPKQPKLPVVNGNNAAAHKFPTNTLLWFRSMCVNNVDGMRELCTADLLAKSGHARKASDTDASYWSSSAAAVWKFMSEADKLALTNQYKAAKEDDIRQAAAPQLQEQMA
jgi:hypothetical protein